MTPMLCVIVFGLLETKHLLADYIWQTNAMVQRKGTYGDLVGASHSLLHAALGALIVLVATPASLLLALGIGVFEFILHYHTDWAKDQLTRRFNQTPKQWGYWVLVGLDQYVHHMTYVAIVAILVIAI